MSQMAFETAVIVVIDDNEANLVLLDRILRNDGFRHIHCISEVGDVAALKATLDPDIVLLDLHMPGRDGFALLPEFRRDQATASFLPIIMLTADATIETKRNALSLGANDFLAKPFDTIEVVLRIRNLLETRMLSRELHRRNSTLDAEVRERTSALEAARLELVERLARTGEYRDDDTGLHAQRVGRLAQQIAMALGLDERESAWIQQAAQLHDLGKVAVPDQILLKPGPLTAQEFDLVKTHTTIGAAILAGSHFPILQYAEQIAHTHHERWDGAGYPNGLRGDAIPLPGRIVAVADAFDVITHARPYKAARPLSDAHAALHANAGSQFDPVVVAACLQVTADQSAWAALEGE